MIIIVSIVAVKRGEAEMRAAGNEAGHGGPVPAEGPAVAAAPAAKTGKAAGPVIEEINVGLILILGIGVFTVTVLALLGLSLIEHMN